MKTFIFLMLLILTVPIKAQTELKEWPLPILCGDAKNILQGLREKYEEQIVFMAPSTNEVGENLFHSLWINPTTSTWSFVVLNKERSILCVISSGDGAVQFTPDTI